MSPKALFGIAAVALLCACGPRGAVVYGGAAGTGGQQSQPTSTDNEVVFVVTDDMPEECAELQFACDSCDEVERTRRRILRKKCVRVCEPYIEAGPDFAANVSPEVNKILRTTGVCGKTETTCSAIERSQCAYAMNYSNVGRGFLTNWASTSDVPATRELLGAYYEQVLKPVDALHRQVFEWGRVNESDVGPLLGSSVKILEVRLGTTQQEVLGEAAAALPPKGTSPEADKIRQMYKNAKSLTEAVMAPGGSLEAYRSKWDVANESFVLAQSSSKPGAE